MKKFLALMVITLLTIALALGTVMAFPKAPQGQGSGVWVCMECHPRPNTPPYAPSVHPQGMGCTECHPLPNMPPYNAPPVNPLGHT